MKEVEEYQRTDCYKQFRKQVEEEEAAKQRAIQDAKEAEKKKSKAPEKVTDIAPMCAFCGSR